jgi:uncharacterized protein DUF1801
MTCPPPPRDVSSALEAFSWPVRRRLLEVRRLIFAAAEASAGVGLLTETLKWGEPAYLTEKTGSGSTIRLGCVKGSAQHCAVLFNCRTTLVETFRDRFPDEFQYRDNRALLLNVTGPLPKAALSVCLSMALTYHLHGRRATSQGAPLIPGGKLRSTRS